MIDIFFISVATVWLYFSTDRFLQPKQVQGKEEEKDIFINAVTSQTYTVAPKSPKKNGSLEDPGCLK